LSLLRTRAMAKSFHDPPLQNQIEDRVHALRILVSRLQTRVGGERGLDATSRIDSLSRALSSRMFGPPALVSAALVEHLPSLGFDECVVSELVQDSSPPELQVAFGFHAEDVRPKPTRYAASALIPPDFTRLRTQSAVVMPLTYGPEALGIAILPARSADRHTYDLLRALLSTTLKGMLLARPRP
jgi:hypothetical protein